LVSWRNGISHRPILARRKIRLDIRTALAACSAGEFVFKIGQPDVVGPLIGADPDKCEHL
jgi:hypothetical protein